MAIYKLARIVGPSDPVYDCNDGFVIRASHALRARQIAQAHAECEGGDEVRALKYYKHGSSGPDPVWLDPERSTCSIVGLDRPGYDDGEKVIMVDYHAG